MAAVQALRVVNVQVAQPLGAASGRMGRRVDRVKERRTSSGIAVDPTATLSRRIAIDDDRAAASGIRGIIASWDEALWGDHTRTRTGNEQRLSWMFCRGL